MSMIPCVNNPDWPLSTQVTQAGTSFVCLACLATPLSTSMLGLFSTLAILCWLLSGRFLRVIEDCKTQPALFFSLLLFSFMTLAISYSPADLPQALDGLKKYRELLYLPAIYSLLSASRQSAKRAESCMLIGCILLLVLSFAMRLGLIPAERYGNSIVFHITHSFFMAVLAFWALHRACDSSPPWRWSWLAIYIGTVINLFYIAPGRTGMFIFACLMLLFFLQRFSREKVVASVILFVIATTLVYYTSENFSGRIDQVVQEVKNYKPGHSRTSIGQRFDWWSISIELIKKKPLFGHGTGSFLIAQQQSAPHNAVKPTDNPHNEFLFITVQFGLVGLALFAALMYYQLLSGRKLDKQSKFMLQGVITALLSGSLMNSLLFDSHQGHFYLLMSAALMAGGHLTSEPARQEQR